MHRLKLSGRRFGYLTVVRRSGKTRGGNYRWWCRCDCGMPTVVAGGALTSGHIKSCGCHQGWPKDTPDTRNKKGERNSQHILTTAQVLEIRERRGENQRELGEEYGVAQCTISAVQTRKDYWSHVE